MFIYLVIAAAFVGVACLVGGVAMMFGQQQSSAVEDRLDFFTNPASGSAAKKEASVLSSPLEETTNVLELYLAQFLSFKAFLQQADTTITPSKFAVMTFALFLAPTLLGPLGGLPLMVGPVIGLILALGPFLYLFFKRKRRLAKFGAQLPEALELVARALRAGHSLASGFRLVAEEMRPPIGVEFHKAYESQNFGVSLEQALEDMTIRVPNLDLRFFATAVILQRQTGGDLAEILDKIGHLVRERFKIWGQIQALTGEGRLSGIVLLAMPPALFLVMFRMNPEYCMVLFRDPMGQQMLGVAIAMQILGALVIRKIVNIRVQPFIAEIVMSFVLIAFGYSSYLWLAQLGAFGLIAALAWLAMDWFAPDDTRTDERLAELRDPMLRKRKEDLVGKRGGNVMTRMLEDAAPSFAKPLQPQNELEANKLKAKLSYAGFRNESAAPVFLGLKLFIMLSSLFIGGGWSLFAYGLTQAGIMRLVVFAGGGFYLPELVLWYLAKQRKDAIFFGLPDALDLLVVCVEAGLGLDQAMRKVAEEMKKSYRVIADEFNLCNLQLQVGRARTQVLQELGNRSGVDDLKSLSSILIQADKFGSSIAQALRVQSEAMRTRRKQIAEEKAAKTAVQLIFPLVLFIFPGIFVVLVGPAAITMVREMFPAMGG